MSFHNYPIGCHRRHLADSKIVGCSRTDQSSRSSDNLNYCSGSDYSYTERSNKDFRCWSTTTLLTSYSTTFRDRCGKKKILSLHLNQHFIRNYLEVFFLFSFVFSRTV